jgi:hypothetical protein
MKPSVKLQGSVLKKLVICEHNEYAIYQPGKNLYLQAIEKFMKKIDSR